MLPEAQRKFTATTYDAVGNVLSIKDPVGNTTRYTYDGLNRLLTDTNELNKTRTYGYDAAGNRVSMSDRNGRTTRYTYDGLNRQTAETWLNGSGGAIRTISSTYDAADQLKSISDPDSSYAFTYDLKGQLQTVDNQGTPGTPRVLLTYTYDANGNVISVLDAINGTNAGTTAYTYDVLNRVTQIAQSGAGVQTKRVDFGYNPVGQFDSIRRYSDLNGTQLVADTRYSYDGLNRLQGLQHNRANSSTIASYTYGYDSSSRITSIASVFANSSYNDTTTYNYDNTSQLTGADHSAITDESYQYDANGNRLNYQTGSNNQLSSDGTYNYAYDNEGNLTQRTEIATGKTRSFVWDYRNRLTEVIDKNASGTLIQDVGYTYDALNQRIAKTVEGQTTRFVYDRGNVYLEFTGANPSTPSTRYLYGPMVDQVLAQESASATPENRTTWMLTDHLGSIRDLVNNSGNVVNHFTYDSFGKVISSMPNAVVDTRYKYTGREFDAETGLHYYRARYYDAGVGRFIGQDPLGFGAKDANLYRYVSNNSLNNTDPSGMYSRNLQVLLIMAKGGTNRQVYTGYPISSDYKTALITATNWFFLITVPLSRAKEDVSKSSIGLDWLLKGRLRNTSSNQHGGFGQLRPFGATAPDPTIDLLPDEKRKTHQTPGHEQVKEVKFLFSKGKREKVPCPVLIPAREPKLGDMNPGPGPIPKPPTPTPAPAPAPAPIQLPNPFDWIPPGVFPLPGRETL